MSVFLRKRGGDTSPTYYTKVYWQGRQILRNTKLTVKRDAEQFERDLLKSLADGRADVLHQIAHLRQAVQAVPAASTLAELRDAWRAQAAPHLCARLMREVPASLALIVRESLGAEPDVWARQATCLTPDTITRWQAARVTAAGTDERAREAAKITANGHWRNARSMFKPQWRAGYRDLILPDLDPLRTVPALPDIQRQYTYRPELVDRTLRHATEPYTDCWGRDQDSLAKTQPAAHLAFLLCFGLGLRKAEAIAAEWTWFEIRPDGRRVCHLQGNATWRGPKGKRERVVPVEPALWDALQKARIPSIGEGPDWVIPGTGRARSRHVWRHLSVWMGRQGWTTRQRAHELRKAFGARAATSAGLFAAQKLLGHAQTTTTSRYYADLVDLPDIRIMSPAPLAKAG